MTIWLSSSARVTRKTKTIPIATARDDETEPPPNGASGCDDTPIEELELGVRSYNCLKREGVETVGDLIRKSEQELMCIPNFGRKSIEEVRERLGQNNLKLRGE